MLILYNVVVWVIRAEGWTPRQFALRQRMRITWDNELKMRLSVTASVSSNSEFLRYVFLLESVYQLRP